MRSQVVIDWELNIVSDSLLGKGRKKLKFRLLRQPRLEGPKSCKGKQRGQSLMSELISPRRHLLIHKLYIFIVEPPRRNRPRRNSKK